MTTRSVKPPLLTIEGQSYKVPSERWFYYTRLRNSPDWFVDLVDHLSPTILPTGVIVFNNLANGYLDLQPNSLVFVTTTSVANKKLYAIQQLRVESVTEA